MTIEYGLGMLGVGILALIIGGGMYILTPLQRQDTLSYYDRKTK